MARATTSTTTSAPHGSQRLNAIFTGSALLSLLGLAQQGLQVAVVNATDDVIQHDAVGVDQERLGYAPHAPVDLGARGVDHRPAATVRAEVRPHGVEPVVEHDAEHGRVPGGHVALVEGSQVGLL